MRHEAPARLATPAADERSRSAGSPKLAPRVRFYVSYARADPSDPDRERGVDLLCNEALKRGINVLRDKTDWQSGELISSFMKELGEGDRVFVFLGDKYLRSSYCMTELFELWNNSKHNKISF
jgi:internalin A